MSDWVDFAKVKSLVSIADVLAHYGVNDLKRKADELVGNCPFNCGHIKTNKRVFSANTTKNNFQCFHCGAKGNVIDFVQLKENCTIRESALKLADWFKIDSGKSDSSQSRGVIRKENGSVKTGVQTSCGKR